MLVFFVFFLFACVLVCLCACVLVCLCACVLVCLCACVLVCLFACMFVCLYVLYVFLFFAHATLCHVATGLGNETWPFRMC